MRSGLLPARVVHIHPTRACNLACSHCYSASSPAERTWLDPELLLDALRELRGEGYEVLSISGGEPLVYRGLQRLMQGASECGYRIHLVTNGLLLTERRLKELRDYLHVIAVSLDGAESVHNQVRGRQDAFAKATRAIDLLSRGTVPFGIAFGASHHSLPDIPSIYELARAMGAALLHIRPIVATGRARTLADAWMLTGEDCTRLVVLGDLLDCGSSRLPRVQVDLLAAESLPQAREQFALLNSDGSIASLSDAVNPLVIDELGNLIPFAYGVHADFAMGKVGDHLRASIAQYMTEGAALTIALLEASFAEAQARGAEYIDWFAHVTEVSTRFSELRPLS